MGAPQAPPAGDDRTRLAPAAPPASPPAGAPPAATPSAAAAGAPAAAPPAEAAPPAHDATVVLPRAQPAAASTTEPAPPDASRTVGATAEPQDATILVPSAATAQVARLERVLPKDQAETFDLTRSTYVFGRSRSSDVRLVTATASREHARISRQGGRWVIEPLAHKTVIAGGVRITRGTVQLTHRMRLKMGEDEFLFLDESAPPSEPEGRQTWWGRVLAFFRGWAPKAGD